MGYSAAQIERDRIRLARGVVLQQCFEHQPVLLTMLEYAMRAVGLDSRALKRELEYMEKRSWITIDRDVAVAIGRRDWAIRLTADGEDIARGIDPKEPLMPEGVV